MATHIARLGPRLKVGDRVTMVNDYGVAFPGKVITGVMWYTFPEWGIADWRYMYTPTDAPWFWTPERNLRMITSERASEIVKAAGEFPYWGNYRRFMTPEEIAEVESLWDRAGQNGRLSFASILHRIHLGCDPLTGVPIVTYSAT